MYSNYVLVIHNDEFIMPFGFLKHLKIFVQQLKSLIQVGLRYNL